MDFAKQNKSASLILAAIIISHIGWLYETCLFLLLYGGFHDRGFINLPLCPIYGITILIVYYLIGTPRRGGAMISRIPTNGYRMIAYLLLAALIPALMELITGEVMELVSGNVLWSYESYALRIGKYACLEIAALWGIAIFIAMSFFEWFIKCIDRIPSAIALRLSGSLSALIAIDFFGCIAISLT